MDRLRPAGDIDYVVMSSAHEEFRLAELLFSFRDEYRGAADPLSQVRRRLEQLILESKVGIYEAETGRRYKNGKEYRELTPEEALSLIRIDKNWDWEVKAGAKSVFYLFAKDKDYWGTYYGSTDRSTDSTP